MDKARLAEALHLRHELGEAVWSGLGEANIPVLLWNRDYSFLVGYPDPPSDWRPIADDSYNGQPHHRQPSNEPQNFAARVGDRWAASMATKGETDAFVMEMIREALPSAIERIFPYRLLIQPSEVQVSAVLHESFHAYQAQMALQRLRKAEEAHSEGERYWAADAAMHDDWRQEIALLTKAIKAPSEQETAALARQFLEQRTGRRSALGPAPRLNAYERQIEWEEGLAKYVELAIWRAACTADRYEPLPDMTADPDFKGYATFPRRWSQEIAQMGRQAGVEGETRF